MYDLNYRNVIRLIFQITATKNQLIYTILVFISLRILVITYSCAVSHLT